MSRTDPRRPSPTQEAKPEPLPEPSARDARRRGWNLAFLIWMMGFLFLAVLMLFDLIAGLFGR